MTNRKSNSERWIAIGDWIEGGKKEVKALFRGCKGSGSTHSSLFENALIVQTELGANNFYVDLINLELKIRAQYPNFKEHQLNVFYRLREKIAKGMLALSEEGRLGERCLSDESERIKCLSQASYRARQCESQIEIIFENIKKISFTDVELIEILEVVNKCSCSSSIGR